MDGASGTNLLRFGIVASIIAVLSLVNRRPSVLIGAMLLVGIMVAVIGWRTQQRK